MPAKESALVDSGTKSVDRDMHIEHFKQGKLKYLVTVAALAIGFDADVVDYRRFTSHRVTLFVSANRWARTQKVRHTQ